MPGIGAKCQSLIAGVRVRIGSMATTCAPLRRVERKHERSEHQKSSRTGNPSPPPSVTAIGHGDSAGKESRRDIDHRNHERLRHAAQEAQGITACREASIERRLDKDQEQREAEVPQLGGWISRRPFQVILLAKSLKLVVECDSVLA